MSENMTTIEIKGVKMEIDLRHAKRVEEMRVGDRVKVLITSDYSEDMVRPGIIIGFEPFESLPTIVVAYVNANFGSTEIKFVYFNAKTENAELVKCLDDDTKAFDKIEMVNGFDREIAKKHAEAKELEEKKAYFLNKFEAYWVPVETDHDEETVN